MGEGWLGDRDSDVLGDRSGRGGKSLPRPRPWGKVVVASAFVRYRPAYWGWCSLGGRYTERPGTDPRFAWGLLVADGR